MQCHALAGLMPVLLAVPGAAAPGSVVTEADVLSRLNATSPAVVSQSLDRPLAEAAVLAARRVDNPVLALGREDPDGGTEQTEWSLSWQLPRAARTLEIAAATSAVDAATARVEDRLRSLRGTVRRDFARWAVASRRAASLAASVDRLDSLTTRERLRATQGETSGLAVRRLELAASALRARRALAVADEEQARGAVRGWWPELPADARPGLPALPQPPRLDVDSSHPRIDAARADVEVAELTRRASRRVVDSPELTVGWQRQESFSDSFTGPVLGLAWSVPLFDRRRAERAAAQARLDAARADAEMAVRTIDARRARASTHYSDLVREAAAARSVLTADASTLDAAEASFRYGELALTDLLEIERSIRDARLAWLDLHAAALAAHRELEALAPSNPVSPHPSTPDED